MRYVTCVIALGLVAGLTGCAKEDTGAKDPKTAAMEQQPKVSPDDLSMAAKPAPKPASAMRNLSSEEEARLNQTVASSFGKGSIKDSAGNTYTFSIEGSMLKDNTSYGRFRFYSFQGDGKLDVQGDMSCVYIDSAERHIWMAGEITENSSTVDKFRQGVYAAGGFVSFRARPNGMTGTEMIPGAIEVPAFVSEVDAAKFCQNKNWSDSGLIELGGNDLIAAIP